MLYSWLFVPGCIARYLSHTSDGSAASSPSSTSSSTRSSTSGGTSTSASTSRSTSTSTSPVLVLVRVLAHFWSWGFTCLSCVRGAYSRSRGSVTYCRTLHRLYNHYSSSCGSCMFVWQLVRSTSWISLSLCYVSLCSHGLCCPALVLSCLPSCPHSTCNSSSGDVT
jgi:hypothetical protein